MRRARLRTPPPSATSVAMLHPRRSPFYGSAGSADSERGLRDRAAGTGRPRHAGERTGRAARARRLVVQGAELREIARADPGVELVEIEDRAGPRAGGSAGVDRARLVVGGTELRQ